MTAAVLALAGLLVVGAVFYARASFRRGFDAGYAAGRAPARYAIADQRRPLRGDA